MKTSELIGAPLDWATFVALGLGHGAASVALRNYLGTGKPGSPSTIWAQGGPIIDENLIAPFPHWINAGYDLATGRSSEGEWQWVAYILGPTNIEENHEQFGPTPLIAVTRCFVSLKLGADVDIPDEITRLMPVHRGGIAS